MNGITACLLLLACSSVYAVRGRLIEAQQLKCPHSSVVAADADLVERVKSYLEKTKTDFNKKDSAGLLAMYSSDAKMYVEGACSSVYDFSDFKDYITVPPEGADAVVNFLEDTLEVEILSSDAGLILTVANWEFASPTNSASNTRIRNAVIWQKHDDGEYYAIRDFASECDV